MVNFGLIAFRQLAIDVGGTFATVGAILLVGANILEALGARPALSLPPLAAAPTPSAYAALRAGQSFSAAMLDPVTQELATELSRGVRLEGSFAAGELTLTHGSRPIAVLDDAVADLVRQSGGARSVQFVVALRPGVADNILAISISA